PADVIGVGVVPALVGVDLRVAAVGGDSLGVTGLRAAQAQPWRAEFIEAGVGAHRRQRTDRGGSAVLPRVGEVLPLHPRQLPDGAADLVVVGVVDEPGAGGGHNGGDLVQGGGVGNLGEEF